MPDQSRRKHKWYRIHSILNRLTGIGNARVYWTIKWLSCIAFWLAAAFLAAVPFCDPQGQQLDDWWSVPLGSIHSNRFSIAVIVILVQLVLRMCIWIAEKLQSLQVEKLERVLDYLVRRHFAKRDKSQYTYRATLFKVRSCWLSGCWLGIVARSGTRYPQRSTVFCIDAKTKKHNTGIAGECWWQEGQTIIVPLPELDEISPLLGTTAEYKRVGFLDDREFDAMNVRSTVFLATGIRVRGKVWGILVLDTTDSAQYPGSTRKSNRRREDLEFAAVALGELVS